MNTQFRSRLDDKTLEDFTEKLRAIAHPIRITIIDMLRAEKSMSVSEIHNHLDIQQAVASHHLRILKNKGIVEVVRSGKNSLYSLVDTRFFNIVEILESV